MENTYIKLYRSIIDSDVFASEKLLKIWVWCLCRANFKDRTIPFKSGKGQLIISVKRGEFVFGRHSAEDDLYISGSTIYKCLKSLEQLGMIKINSNNQYSIITLCNYDEYQGKDIDKGQAKDKQGTGKGQASNTDNKDNKDKKDNKFIAPTEKQVIEYFIEKGFDVNTAKKAFEYYDLADWKDSKGNKVKNWKQKMLANWMNNNYNKAKKDIGDSDFN